MLVLLGPPAWARGHGPPARGRGGDPAALDRRPGAAGRRTSLGRQAQDSCFTAARARPADRRHDGRPPGPERTLARAAPSSTATAHGRAGPGATLRGGREGGRSASRCCSRSPSDAAARRGAAARAAAAPTTSSSTRRTNAEPLRRRRRAARSAPTTTARRRSSTASNVSRRETEPVATCFRDRDQLAAIDALGEPKPDPRAAARSLAPGRLNARPAPPHAGRRHRMRQQGIEGAGSRPELQKHPALVSSGDT